MPQETIDLDKIIANEPNGDWFSPGEVILVKRITTEACRQILSLAAERAKVKSDPGVIQWPIVDKESITSCINLIKS